MEVIGVLRDEELELAEFERNFLQQRTLPGRIANALGKFAGSFTSVILHGFWFGGWVFINLGMVLSIQPFDEFPFYTLQFLVALEAIFLSTFVLMRQNASIPSPTNTLTWLCRSISWLRRRQPKYCRCYKVFVTA
jgi:uncharacterized membrane protein